MVVLGPCACFDSHDLFWSSPLVEKEDKQLQNDGRHRSAGRYSGQKGQLIGPEEAQEGFLAGEALGSAAPISSSCPLGHDQPTWDSVLAELRPLRQ